MACSSFCKCGSLFGLGGVGGFHHDLDEVALGEHLLHQGSDVFLGEVVDGLLVFCIAVYTVGVEDLDAATPPAVVLTVLGQVLLEVELGHGEFFVGGAVLGQVLEALDGDGAELVAEGGLAVPAYEEHTGLFGTAGEAALGAGAIGAAFLFTQGVGVVHIEDVGDGIHSGVLGVAERSVQAVHLIDGALGSLHIYLDHFLNLTLDNVDVVVHPLQRLLALRQGTDVFLDNGLDGLGIHITHDDHRGTGGIGEEFLPVLLHYRQAGLVQNFLGDHLAAGVVAVEGAVQLGLELVVGLVHQVGQDSGNLVKTVLPLLGIEAGIRPVEVQELHGRLEVLHGAAAVDAVLQLVEVRTYAEALAGEHLGDGGAGEGRYTAVALEQAEHVAVEGREVFVGNQGQTAVLDDIEQDLVFLEIRGIDNHPDTVGEGPLGGAVDGGTH